VAAALVALSFKEASMFTNYYEILEISPNATSETIDRMFRYLARRYHPDNQDTALAMCAASAKS
jgi:curved DNA-binding protein CbpA